MKPAATSAVLLLSSALLAVLSTAGCGGAANQQYDFGRAYADAIATQADLTRPSVADAAYVLSGEEGILLRQRVIEESTDTESGQAEFTQSITAE